jgi:hypothetical protein
MPILPIVGSKHRPPALALVSGLPQGTRIYLRAEPQNPVDENAIQVILQTVDLENLTEEEVENLNQELANSGKTLDEDIIPFDEFHLGYIPAKLAFTLRFNQNVVLDKLYPGEFQVSFRGSPQIEVELDNPNN